MWDMGIDDIVGIIVGVVGALIGLYGWSKGRRDIVIKDAEWRSKVDTMLGVINNGVNGVNCEIAKINDKLTAHTADIAELQSSTKSAHHRIDEIVTGKKES